MDQDDQRFSLLLQEAVSIWRREPGSPANTYDWYRRSAQRSGEVSMGRRRQLAGSGQAYVHVDAKKISGRWMVDAKAFKDARIVPPKRNESK